jgi:hypothetical protein
MSDGGYSTRAAEARRLREELTRLVGKPDGHTSLLENAQIIAEMAENLVAAEEDAEAERLAVYLDEGKRKNTFIWRTLGAP